MADFAQRLILLAALAAGAAASAPCPRPFSHRLHLKLKPDCLACHVTAATSTRPEENNLPPKDVCLPCHKEVTIKEPRALAIARFDHSKHVSPGDVARAIGAAIDKGLYLSDPGGIRRRLDGAGDCSACHRGMSESDEVSRAAFPQMADCLVCHSKIEPPFSCEFCHQPGENLKPASHTPDYLDLHNSGKLKLDNQSCAVCHGRRFKCLGCH